MQKLITVSIDTNQLKQHFNDPFTINHVDSVNELLEQGWEVEKWDILKAEGSDGHILLMLILNDDAIFDKDDEFDDEFDFEDDDDDDDDEDSRPGKLKRVK